MAEIRWTKEAAAWLQDIFEYLSEESPQVAAKVVDGIFEKVQLLSEFPEIGHKYRDEREGEIRILLYGHYRIAYIAGHEAVTILGVFHGALDIDKYLP